jgi:hypothetical protein
MKDVRAFSDKDCKENVNPIAFQVKSTVIILRKEFNYHFVERPYQQEVALRIKEKEILMSNRLAF